MLTYLNKFVELDTANEKGYFEKKDNMGLYISVAIRHTIITISKR